MQKSCQHGPVLALALNGKGLDNDVNSDITVSTGLSAAHSVNSDPGDCQHCGMRSPGQHGKLGSRVSIDIIAHSLCTGRLEAMPEYRLRFRVLSLGVPAKPGRLRQA